MADPDVPRSWTQLNSWGQIERWRDRDGLIVILDTPTVSHYHHPQCSDVAERHFETKRANGRGNGAYYWIADAADAAGYATACGNCHGQPPEAAAIG
jgi:hypothetical protein